MSIVEAGIGAGSAGQQFQPSWQSSIRGRQDTTISQPCVVQRSSHLDESLSYSSSPSQPVACREQTSPSEQFHFPRSSKSGDPDAGRQYTESCGTGFVSISIEPAGIRSYLFIY